MRRERLIEQLKRLGNYRDELIESFSDERIMRAIEHEKRMKNASYFRENNQSNDEYECGTDDNLTTYVNGTKQRRRSYR